MTVSPSKALVAGLMVAVLSGCNEPVTTTDNQATSIYTNGQIVSVDDNVGTVEAIAVKDGLIVALGSNSEIKSYQGKDTKLIDLQGKTLLHP